MATVNVSTSGHTPGPWYCDPSDTKRDFPARQMVFGGGHLIAEVAGNGNGDSGANARLIAAAPDLLAALVELLYNTDDGTNLCGRVVAERAKAAVSKATGE